MVMVKLFAVSFILAVMIYSIILLFGNGLNKNRTWLKKEGQTTHISLPDYGIYVMTFLEKIVYTVLAAVFIFTIAYVFYRSVLISALVMPLAVFYPKMKSKNIAAGRRRDLNVQFKESLYSLASSISAGVHAGQIKDNTVYVIGILVCNKQMYFRHWCLPPSNQSLLDILHIFLYFSIILHVLLFSSLSI